MPEQDNLSLLELISKRKNRYELSFVTTFNAYLPFYEKIILRQLRFAGCRANTLLMDERQFIECLSDDNNQPRLAGMDYTLIPVNNGGGVFHPKIILLIGCENGLLCVGSHNMTFSGFGKNREMTATFEFDLQKDSAEKLQIFQSVWQSIKSWTGNQPPELLTSIDIAEQTANWLNDSTAEIQNQKTYFIFSADDSESLWEKTKQYIPDKIKRVTLIAPFFDHSFRFLNKLNEDLKPDEFIVGIEPKTVSLNKEALTLIPNVKFVDVENLRGGNGYQHSKTILIETDSGEEILITGSANASGAAWLESGSRQNAEAIILMLGIENQKTIKNLGLYKLKTKPELNFEDWSLVRERNEPIEVEEDKKENQIFLLAFENENGFEINLQNKNIKISGIAKLFDANNKLISEETITQNEHLFIKTDDAQIKTLTNKIEFDTDKDEKCLVHVHHTRQVASKFYRGKYSDVFAALENFDDSISEQLLQIVEKIIFSDTENYAAKYEASVTDKISDVEDFSFKINQSTNDSPQINFSVSVNEIERKKILSQLHKDSLTELMSLINKKLYSPDISEIINHTSEEALIHADEEETNESKNEKRIATLSKISLTKTKTMMRRMTNQFKKFVGENESDAFIITRQFSAVLNFLHLAKDFEANEVEKEKNAKARRLINFIDEEKLKSFFVESSEYFFSIVFSKFEKEKVETNLILREEIFSIVANLIRFASVLKFDIENLYELQKNSFSENNFKNDFTADEIIQMTSALLKIGNNLSIDENFQNKIKFTFKIISGEVKDNLEIETWLQKHVEWINKIFIVRKNISEQEVLDKKPQTGDLVFLKKIQPAQVFVVVEDSTSNVKIIDYSTKNKTKIISAKPKNEFIEVLNL